MTSRQTHPLQFLILTLAVASLASNAQSTDFVAKNSTEAILRFSSEVEITGARPSEDQAIEKITNQMEHLFGPMGYGAIKAVPRGDYDIRVTRIRKKFLGAFVAQYNVSMTVSVENKAKNAYTVTLPVNPDTIFAAGMKSDKNLCTDAHYQSEGDFWYFWSPDRPGCSLRRGRDYRLVQGTLERIANTKKSFAEADRLADADGTVKIDMLYGLDDPEAHSWNPYDSVDVNAENYVYVSEQLERLGFHKRVMSSSEILEVAPATQSGDMPSVEVFTKDYSGPNTKKIVVRMVFGASGISENSHAFHYFLKDSLEHSSMMIYAGHSGLGGHLDLQGIERREGFKIALPKNKYQILYFNSCTSYTYYNTQYFGRKMSSTDRKGTQNLDIVTNGLETYFNVMDETNLELVKIADDFASGRAQKSYQELAEIMDSGNLLGINGDEDNPIVSR